MANDATKTFVAGDGAVWHAPLGTALPTTITGTINPLFKELGYFDDAGVKRDEPTTDAEIVAWQGAAVVRTIRSKHSVTYAFTALEDNDEVIKATRGSGTAAAYTITGKLPVNEAFVIEERDGTTLRLTCIPNGSVTDIGAMVNSNAGISALPLTITCYPDANGIKAYVYKGTDDDSSF